MRKQKTHTENNIIHNMKHRRISKRVAKLRLTQLLAGDEPATPKVHTQVSASMSKTTREMQEARRAARIRAKQQAA